MLTIVLILIPLVTSLALFLVRNRKIAQSVSILASLANLCLGIYAVAGYNSKLETNFTFNADWIHSLGISFSFGMDGLSLLLVMLTVVLAPVILLAIATRKTEYPASFHALILLMEAALIGVFSSMDGLLFYIFWELALIPIYFICGMWGGENRIKITLKFFIYTMLGSLFMLISLIWLYLKTPYPHSFSFEALHNVYLTAPEEIGIFSAFFLAFAIKTPIFPFHSWQPDTYSVAPAAGSMLLAGLMAKMGLYGILRFLIPTCHTSLDMLAPYLIPLALIGLIYGSVIAIRQDEIKRLIAYSSFAHVGIMAAALFTLNIDALQGSVYQMLSHGFNVIALFFVADIIASRTQTTRISDLGGIARSAPRFAIFFMVVMLASVALPLTNGFIGEFLMLLGLAQYSIWVAAVAGISVILGAVYMFWLYQRTMYGEANPRTENFKDLTSGEMLIAIPLILIILVMGIYPKPILELMKPALDGLIAAI